MAKQDWMKVLSPSNSLVSASQLRMIETAQTIFSVENQSEVIRLAIDALMQTPDVVSTSGGPYEHRLMSVATTDDQIEFVQSESVRKGVSKSQIIRDAIEALTQVIQTSNR